MRNLESQMQVSQKRSVPLRHADMFLNGEHWDAVKVLAKQRDITASELVRRLIAAELRRESRRA
jgi:predicted DNA-binding ribbon-helix-helix protein